MFEIILNSILEHVKENKKHFVPVVIIIFIFTSLIILISEVFPVSGLISIYENHKNLIWSICLLSLITLVICFYYITFNKIAAERKRKQIRKEQIKRLKRLSKKQKQILKNFTAEMPNKQQLDSTDGDILELILLGIIVATTNIVIGNYSTGTEYCSYAAQPWVIEYINKYPNILSGL